MQTMRAKETANTLEEAREALNKALPEEVRRVRIVRQPDGTVHIEVTLREHRPEENKWVRFAEEMHEESPLRGRSGELTAQVSEFREGFSFERDASRS